MGRPSKLTDESRDKIYEAVQMRAPLHIAARIAGITYATLAMWQAKGRELSEKRDKGEKVPRRDKKYLDFFDGLEDAKAEAIADHLTVVDNAARDDPNWAWRMLQLWLPEEFAPPTKRHELTGRDGRPIEMNNTLPVEQIAAGVAGILEAARSRRDNEAASESEE